MAKLSARPSSARRVPRSTSNGHEVEQPIRPPCEVRVVTKEVRMACSLASKNDRRAAEPVSMNETAFVRI